MKKIIFILALFVSFVANAQKTTGSNYTYFNTRSEWFTGIFQALGLPSGPGPAAFKAGQDMRAGALYYDSVGVDSGLHVWTGVYWRNYATASYTDADARAAIFMTNIGTSGLATYTPATGVINTPDYTTAINTKENLLVNSAGLAAALSDETGTGLSVFNTSPLFTTPRLSSTSTTGYVWTATDASGNGSFQAATGGANTALSNLSSVAINTSLISDADNTDDLGSASIGWKDIYSRTLKLDGSTSGTITFQTVAVAGTNTITFPANTGNVPLLERINAWTQLNNFNGGLTASGGFFSSNNATESNLTALSTSATTTTQSELLFEGASTIAYRTLMRGNTNYTISAGAGVAALVMGQMAYTEAPSLNHPLIAGAVLRAPSITGAAATVSNTATLYIDAAPSATVSDQNSSIWVASGNVRLGKAGTAIGTMSFEGNTSGKVTLTPAAAAGTPTLTFPTTSGTFALTNQLSIRTKNINLPLPSSAENEFTFFTPFAITITNTRVVLVGSASPSVTYNIAFGTDRTSLTNVYTAGQTVTSTTTGTDASGVNDNTIPANSWVVLTTSAQSGTVTSLNASIAYTVD